MHDFEKLLQIFFIQVSFLNLWIKSLMDNRGWDGRDCDGGDRCKNGDGDGWWSSTPILTIIWYCLSSLLFFDKILFKTHLYYFYF